ncbi:MAG TPA: ABC transporter substrate-binding protein [Stellaceae bacterium]|nr:ABC transporter substrate-binding protein [Stellaceae bacterium]
MRLRLFENYRFVLYAPFYAAHAIGAYEQEGLDVALLPSPGPRRAETAVIEGAAEFMWAGPLRVLQHHDNEPSSPLVCFAEVVCRDPFSLIGARPNPHFRPNELGGLRFATVSEVPTPWLCLQQDLREAGLDPSRIDRIADRSMAENLAALRAGRIDAAQLFEPFVEEAIATAGLHLWHAASSRGRTSYTAFVTTRERLSEMREALAAVVRAIGRAQQWVAMREAPEIAAAVASFFPTLPRARLTGAIARYQGQGVWGRDPVLPEKGFERLEQALLAAGFIGRNIGFAACVDNSIALGLTA